MKLTLQGTPQEIKQELVNLLDDYKLLPSPEGVYPRPSLGTCYYDSFKKTWKVIWSRKNRTIYIGSHRDHEEALLMQRAVQECLALCA